MSIKRYKQLRAAVAFFIAAIVSISTIQHSFVLAVVTVVIGMLFLMIVRSRTAITIDERERTIRERAAHLTYAIFAPTIGIGAFLLSLPYDGLSPVFAKGDFLYLQSLGMVFAYITLFLIAVYAISYYFVNRKLGGGGNEE